MIAAVIRQQPIKLTIIEFLFLLLTHILFKFQLIFISIGKNFEININHMKD